MQQEAQVKSGLGQLDRFGRVPQVRLGAVLALALAAAFVVWLVLRNDDGSSTVDSPAAASAAAIPKTAGIGPVAQSPQDLQRFAAAGGRPVYWAGPMAGYRYELTQTRNNRVFVRYLPSNVAVGVDKPLLTIATYPFPKAFDALKALAKNQGGAIELDHGGLALVDRAYPKSIHLAYPGVRYQIEVFSPSPQRTREIVISGRIAAVR
jgi:hypothetical protein